MSARLLTGLIVGLLLAAGAGWVAAGTPTPSGWTMHAGDGHHGGGMHAQMHARMHGEDVACDDCHAPGETAAAHVVTMRGSQYAPATLVVKVGERVEWVNEDDFAHTVTSDQGLFDSGSIPPGAAWSFTFEEPGTYDYHCVPHSAIGSDGAYRGMVGRVVVEA